MNHSIRSFLFFSLLSLCRRYVYHPSYSASASSPLRTWRVRDLRQIFVFGDSTSTFCVNFESVYCRAIHRTGTLSTFFLSFFFSFFLFFLSSFLLLEASIRYNKRVSRTKATLFFPCLLSHIVCHIQALIYKISSLLENRFQWRRGSLFFAVIAGIFISERR